VGYQSGRLNTYGSTWKAICAVNLDEILIGINRIAGEEKWMEPLL